MYYIFEFIIVLLVLTLFIKKEKPNLKFIFLGILFFLISQILQIPFIILQNHFINSMNLIIPTIITIIITILISETTKYLSLKKHLKTKSYKNAIVFIITWTGLESINFITQTIYKIILNYLNLNYVYSNLIFPDLNFLNFLFLFIFNLAISIFVIFSIIKKKKIYLFFAILLSISINLLLIYLKSHKTKIAILILIYSLYIIFNYKKLK